MNLSATARTRPTLRTALGVLALAVPLALAGCGADDSPAEEAAADGTTAASQSRNGSSDAAECPPAVITTDAGAITVDLLEEKAPATVNNFVFLARNNYYDGITFHRVIPGFMIQGGDPQGTGSGGPGYEFADELPADGEYEIGSLAMANAGPDTNGSQFFIVTGPSGVSLPPDYSLFGIVTDGMGAVTAIEGDGSPQGSPRTTHTIESVEIVES